MHDRAVRRRRAVLVVLVAASLFLLTAYFGESSDGRLHSVQRGALATLAPIQEGASRVLKPLRDLFGWVGATGGMGRYRPVNARVYLHSPTSWYQNVTINKGSDDGVQRDDPVINGAG